MPSEDSARRPAAGATWLITGGSGFFGRHFTRHLLHRANPHSVRIYARSEARLAAMRDQLGDDRLRFLVGDVRDRERLAVALHGVDYLVHAAALKRIDTCESDPSEAIATNIMGTHAVLHAAIGAGVMSAVFLSTDKAASPDTLYGVTKLCAERLWVQGNVYAAGRRTRLAVTRYGNVLGSTGSVVPLWQEQADDLGSITITDPKATRFWMTADDACALVGRAFEDMHGGETFLRPMRSSTLGDLAQVVAPTAEAAVTGLRLAEKPHECLFTAEEARRMDHRNGAFFLRPLLASWTPPALPSPFMPEVRWRSSDTAERWALDELRRAVDVCTF